MTIRSPRRLAVAVLCVAVLLTVVVIAVVRNSKSPATLSASSGPQTIRTADGTRLSAYSYVPGDEGPHPLLVMPASWGSPATEYASVAYGYAALGYVVVAYAQRGFGGSTGEIDLAGPGSQSDVTTVISWALVHTPAARNRIGVVGASYGAGVGLLAAEHDSRIRAVVALSGWTDLAQTLAPGGTLSRQAYATLFAAVASARLSPDVRTFVAQLRAGDAAAALATLRRLSPFRSAVTDVAALNRRGTAVMIGDAYQDSLLPPAPVVRFFEQLTAPKRLELAVGDHSGPALSGLRGQKNALWENAARWTNRYVAGDGTGIQTQQPVQLEDANTQQVRGYPSWAAVGRARTLRLTTLLSGVGQLAGASAPWTHRITAGVDTSADAGPEQFNTGQPYRVPALSLAGISRSAGAVWNAPTVASPTLVSGVVSLHAAVTVAAPASLFAYLYDVDAGGTGRLITTGTMTLTGAGPADINLEPISWTVPAGHHVSVVVDTVDPRYLGRSVPGSTVTIGSTAADPATLSVPLG
ncbi:MAG: alpha/beta fold hydrolase [Jatrophihabitantaceae bacterium]